jgi:hypothetical protein
MRTRYIRTGSDGKPAQAEAAPTTAAKTRALLNILFILFMDMNECGGDKGRGRGLQ